MDQQSGQGYYVTWRDLETHRQLEQAARADLEARIMATVNSNSTRLRTVESVIDQQRGAKALVYFLIGSNLLVLVSFLANR